VISQTQARPFFFLAVLGTGAKQDSGPSGLAIGSMPHVMNSQAVAAQHGR
jgi:hypothetical protein